MRAVVYRLLGIQTSDQNKLMHLAPVFILLGAAYSLGIIASKSLFVSRFGVEYLPLMYLVEACVLPLQLWLIGYLSQRLARGTMIKTLFSTIVLILLLGTMFLFSMLLLDFEWPYFYPILFVTSSILLRILIPLMWMLGDGICLLQQAKRLFPVLGVLFIVGGAAGGAIANNIGKVFVGLGTEMAYLTMQLLLIISIFFWLRIISKYFLATDLEADNDKGAPMGEVIKHIWNMPLLKVSLTGFIILMSLYYIIDYRFFMLANAKFPDSDQLTSFYGLFIIALYGASLVVGLNLNRLYTKLGIGITVLAMGFMTFLVLVASSILAITSWSLQAFMVANIAMDILAFTLLPTLSQVYYKLLPAYQRAGVSLVFAGSINAGGKLVSSAITGMHSSSLITLLGLSIIAISMATIYVMLTWKQKKLYLSSLLDSLYRNTVGVKQLVSFNLGQLLSKADLLPLKQALTSDDSVKQLIGLELAGHIRKTSILPEVKLFLKSRDSRKRKLALQALPDSNNELREVIESALLDQDQAIRSIAVEKIIKLPNVSAKELLCYINDESPIVTKQVIIALAKEYKLGQTTIIYNRLDQLLAGDNESRVQAYIIIKELHEMKKADLAKDINAKIKHIEDINNKYEQKLLQQLTLEKNVRVRSALIDCLGELASQSAVEPLIDSYPDADRELQKTIVKALVKIGEVAVEQLLNNLNSDNILVWQAVVASLTSIQTQVRNDEVLKQLDESCQKKIDYLLKLKDATELITETIKVDAVSLIQQRLTELEQTILEASWQVLALGVDKIIVQRLRASMRVGASSEQQENAQEVLSELGREHNLTRLIAQLFVSQEKVVQADISIQFKQLREVLQECPDYWLITLADYVAHKYQGEGVARSEA